MDIFAFVSFLGAARVTTNINTNANLSTVVTKQLDTTLLAPAAYASNP